MTHPQPNPPEKVESLVERLRETTAHMANSCSAPMSLWQEHSTAVLHAASRIEALEAQVAGMGEALSEIERVSVPVGPMPDLVSPDDYTIRAIHAAARKARLAAAKEPS